MVTPNPSKTDAKTCPACAEIIKGAARICPYCRQHQGVWSVLNPLVGLPLLLLCVMALAVAFLCSFKNITQPEPEFTPFRNDVYVTSSTMHVIAAGTNSTVVVFGSITNRSPVAWKFIEIECRFRDASGQWIDAKTQNSSLTVLAHDEIAFRLETKAAHPPGDYVTHMAKVRYAVNSRRSL